MAKNTNVTLRTLEGHGNLAEPSQSSALNYHGKYLPKEASPTLSADAAVWRGKGAEKLGLAGAQVTQADYFSIFGEATNPRDGERYASRLANLDQRQFGMEMVFTIPKELSVMWAFARTPEQRQKLTDVLQNAVADTIGFVEQNATYRKSGGGAGKGQGLIYTSHLHCASRPVTDTENKPLPMSERGAIGFLKRIQMQQRKLSDKDKEHMQKLSAHFGLDDARYNTKEQAAALAEELEQLIHARDDIGNTRKYGDPNLHMHVTIANHILGEDNKFHSAGWKEKLLRDEGILEVQGMFAQNFVKQLKVAGMPVIPTGERGIRFGYVGDALTDFYSSRGEIIKAAAEQRGITNPAMKQMLVFMTREEKMGTDGDAPPSKVIADARRTRDNVLNRLATRKGKDPTAQEQELLIDLAKFYRVQWSGKDLHLNAPAAELARRVRERIKEQEIDGAAFLKQVQEYPERYLTEEHQLTLRRLARRYEVPFDVIDNGPVQERLWAQVLSARIEKAMLGNVFVSDTHREITAQVIRDNFFAQANALGFAPTKSEEDRNAVETLLTALNQITDTFYDAEPAISRALAVKGGSADVKQREQLLKLADWWKRNYGSMNPSMEELAREALQRLSDDQQKNPGKKMTTLTRLESYGLKLAAEYGIVIEDRAAFRKLMNEELVVRNPEQHRTLAEQQLSLDLRREIREELAARKGSARMLLRDVAEGSRSVLRELIQDVQGLRRDDIKDGTVETLRAIALSRHGVIAVESPTRDSQKPLVAIIRKAMGKQAREFTELELPQNRDKQQEQLAPMLAKKYERGEIVMLRHAEHLAPELFLSLTKKLREDGARLLLLSTPQAVEAAQLSANIHKLPIGRSVTVSEAFEGFKREQSSPQLLNGLALESNLTAGSRWTIQGVDHFKKQISLLNGDAIAVLPYTPEVRAKLQLDAPSRGRHPEDPFSMMQDAGLDAIRHYPREVQNKNMQTALAHLENKDLSDAFKTLHETGKALALGDNADNRYSSVAEEYWQRLKAAEKDQATRRHDAQVQVVAGPAMDAEEMKLLLSSIRKEAVRKGELAEKSTLGWRFNPKADGMFDEKTVLVANNNFHIGNVKIERGTAYRIDSADGENITLKFLDEKNRGKVKMIVPLAALAEQQDKISHFDAERKAIAAGERIRLTRRQTLYSARANAYVTGERMTFNAEDIASLPKAAKKPEVGVEYIVRKVFEKGTKTPAHYEIAHVFNAEDKADITQYTKGQKIEFGAGKTINLCCQKGDAAPAFVDAAPKGKWEVYHIDKESGQVHIHAAGDTSQRMVLDVKNAAHRDAFETQSAMISVPRAAAPGKMKKDLKEDSLVTVKRIEESGRMVVDHHGEELYLPAHSGAWDYAYITPETKLQKDQRIEQVLAVTAPAKEIGYYPDWDWVTQLADKLRLRELLCFGPADGTPLTRAKEDRAPIRANRNGRDGHAAILDIAIPKPGPDGFGVGPEFGR